MNEKNMIPVMLTILVMVEENIQYSILYLPQNKCILIILVS